MNNKTKYKTHRALTMIEIIVVLAVIAMIASFTIPSMIGIINESKMKREIANARLIYVAAQAQLTQDYNKGKNINKIIYNNENKDISSMLKDDMTLGSGGVKFEALPNTLGVITELQYENNGKKLRIIELDKGYGTVKVG